MERVLGTPALFATAYGNVGSSIYYALGLTAVYALGLTPLVFLLAGIVFAATAATYAEGTARFPEAGGSASFSRHAFDELVSFTAGWSQMLVYVVTVSVSAFFVPHYLSIFWEPLRTNPWDIVGGAIVIVVLVALNIVGVQEAAKLSISLAVVDFATQILLVERGLRPRAQPRGPRREHPLGRRADVVEPGDRNPCGDARVHGRRDGLEPRGGGARPGEDGSKRLQARCRGRLRHLLHAAARRALGASGDRDRRGADDPARASAGGGGIRERSDPRRRPEHRPRRVRSRCGRDLRRHPRRHDPGHCHQRRCNRSVADHLLDGDLPPAAGGAASAPSAVQDAVALTGAVRGHRADPGDPPRRRELRRHAVLAGSHAVVHRCACVDRAASDA